MTYSSRIFTAMRIHYTRNPARSALGILALGGFLSFTTISVSEVARKKSPSSKLFVADVEGKAELNNGDKIVEISKKSVYSAEGAIISTNTDSTNAMAYSNGTGIFFDKGTRLEVRRFQQEPFTPNRVDMEVEPSISNTQAYLAQGSVGLCTSKLVAGSVMNYSTPHATIAIRGRKVVVETSETMTRVSLVEGDLTIRAGDSDSGGQPLRPGEQAVITPSSVGGPPKIVIQPIPAGERNQIDQKVSAACMAKSTVYFEEVRRRNPADNAAAALTTEGEDTEIVATPVTPTDLPVQFTVSNSRLEGGLERR